MAANETIDAKVLLALDAFTRDQLADHLTGQVRETMSIETREEIIPTVQDQHPDITIISQVLEGQIDLALILSTLGFRYFCTRVVLIIWDRVSGQGLIDAGLSAGVRDVHLAGEDGLDVEAVLGSIRRELPYKAVGGLRKTAPPAGGSDGFWGRAEAVKGTVRTDLRAVPHRIVAVLGSKGGVGRTTVAVNVSIAMAKLNQKVAVLDLWPEAWDVAAYMGVREGSAGVAGLLRPEPLTVDRCATIRHGVAVFSRDEDGHYIVIGGETADKLITTLSQEYGIVVIDAPAGIADEAGLRAAERATDILLVIDPSNPLAAEAATRTVRGMRLPEERVRVVANGTGFDAPPAETIVCDLEMVREWSIRVRPGGSIPYKHPLHKQAIRQGRPVAVADPGGIYDALARNLLGLPPVSPPNRSSRGAVLGRLKEALSRA